MSDEETDSNDDDNDEGSIDEDASPSNLQCAPSGYEVEFQLNVVEDPEPEQLVLNSRKKVEQAEGPLDGENTPLQVPQSPTWQGSVIVRLANGELRHKDNRPPVLDSYDMIAATA